MEFYVFIAVIGSGRYGTVLAGKRKDATEIVAMALGFPLVDKDEATFRFGMDDYCPREDRDTWNMRLQFTIQGGGQTLGTFDHAARDPQFPAATMPATRGWAGDAQLRGSGGSACNTQLYCSTLWVPTMDDAMARRTIRTDHAHRSMAATIQSVAAGPTYWPGWNLAGVTSGRCAVGRSFKPSEKTKAFLSKVGKKKRLAGRRILEARVFRSLRCLATSRMANPRSRVRGGGQVHVARTSEYSGVGPV